MDCWFDEATFLKYKHIKLKNCYNHLAGIQFTYFDKNSEISVLIGAGNPKFIDNPKYR